MSAATSLSLRVTVSRSFMRSRSGSSRNATPCPVRTESTSICASLKSLGWPNMASKTSVRLHTPAGRPQCLQNLDSPQMNSQSLRKKLHVISDSHPRRWPIGVPVGKGLVVCALGASLFHTCERISQNSGIRASLDRSRVRPDDLRTDCLGHPSPEALQALKQECRLNFTSPTEALPRPSFGQVGRGGMVSHAQGIDRTSKLQLGTRPRMHQYPCYALFAEIPGYSTAHDAKLYQLFLELLHLKAGFCLVFQHLSTFVSKVSIFFHLYMRSISFTLTYIRVKKTCNICYHDDNHAFVLDYQQPCTDSC